MRSKTIVITACTAALATVAGGVSLASASSEGAGGTTLRFTAVSVAASEQYIDAGEPGESAGDSILFNELTYDGAVRGKPHGHNEIMCVFVSEESARCNGTIFRPEGKLEAGGALHFRRTVRIPVLGGTGAYAGARGEVAITDVSENRSRYVVRLLP